MKIEEDLGLQEPINSRNLMSSKTIYLIDGYNLIYRLFYAVPPFTTKAGKPVNAVFGVAKTLL
jgi:5'-3' exonuclease